MVYYLGRLEISRFNRNILYCKCLIQDLWLWDFLDLIGTFCIVNEEYTPTRDIDNWI